MNASISALQKAQALVLESPDPAFALATIHLRMKNLPNAAESARKALEISPGHPPAWQLLRQLIGAKEGDPGKR